MLLREGVDHRRADRALERRTGQIGLAGQRIAHETLHGALAHHRIERVANGFEQVGFRFRPDLNPAAMVPGLHALAQDFLCGLEVVAIQPFLQLPPGLRLHIAQCRRPIELNQVIALDQIVLGSQGIAIADVNRGQRRGTETVHGHRGIPQTAVNGRQRCQAFWRISG